MKEALLYDSLKNNKVRCNLCAHRCLIDEDKQGICGVRTNTKGVLYSLVYGKLISGHVDPIEKKPLFNFLPGSFSYSIACVGCNFRCEFCQNYEISQAVKDRKIISGEEISPKDVVKRAVENDCKSISYTYTEPTVAFEYVLAVMKLARQEGLYNIFVTNGYMSPEMLEYSKGYLDAANVDLKAFNDEFYKKLCGARLEPVLDAVKKMKKLNIWVEVTTLVIPGINDSPEELEKCAKFILSLGRETPWHISRFYPNYKMDDIFPTPPQKLAQAREIGLNAELRYVYTGNVPGETGENTYCYNCKETVIKRYGFRVLEYNLKNSLCEFCKTPIDGIGL